MSSSCLGCVTEHHRVTEPGVTDPLELHSPYITGSVTFVSGYERVAFVACGSLASSCTRSSYGISSNGPGRCYRQI